MRPTSPHRRRRAADIVQQPWMTLRNPLPRARLISDDEVEALHEAALTILETIGIRCAVKEARDIFARAGALIDESDGRVRVGRDIIEACIEDRTIRPDAHAAQSASRRAPWSR